MKSLEELLQKIWNWLMLRDVSVIGENADYENQGYVLHKVASGVKRGLTKIHDGDITLEEARNNPRYEIQEQKIVTSSGNTACHYTIYERIKP